jgi:hypothetical protein
VRVGYTEGFLDGLRQAGDSSADIVIDKLARAEQVRAVSDVPRSLTYNDQPVQAGELTRQIARRNHRRSDEGILMTRALFELHSGSPAGFEGAARRSRAICSATRCARSAGCRAAAGTMR